MLNMRKTVVPSANSSCPIRKPEVIAQTAQNETMLFDMNSGQYFALNDLGARVWELADGTRTPQQIAAVLEREYDAPYKTIEADVLALIHELCSNELCSSDLLP